MDYELHPFTLMAMALYREGNDQSCSEERRNELIDALYHNMEHLDDLDKDIVIIDLLTVANALEQVVTIMQVQAIEEASK